MLRNTNPYTCRFWYPSTVAYADADYSIELKAFEYGNTENKARNQSITRNRAGTNFVYDRGQNFNETMKLEFRQINDVEKSALVVFLNSVVWGFSRLKMRDHKGVEKTIRFVKTQIEYVDTGFETRNNPLTDITLWDFNLEVLDLTDNLDATGEVPPVSNALGLHLVDYNHPHNPAVSITVDIADGAKVVESLRTRDWKAASWLIVAEKADDRLYKMVSVTHDGYVTTDATAVSTPLQTTLGDTGAVAAVITFSVDLNGAASNQVMRLKAATSVDGYTIRARRMKL